MGWVVTTHPLVARGLSCNAFAFATFSSYTYKLHIHYTYTRLSSFVMQNSTVLTRQLLTYQAHTALSFGE